MHQYLPDVAVSPQTMDDLVRVVNTTLRALVEHTNADLATCRYPRLAGCHEPHNQLLADNVELN